MKLDKETVIKQRFWFLLPIFAICLLVGWICVLGVRGETEKNYKTAKDKDTALKNIASTQHLKNENWNQAISKELDNSSGKKDELWYKESDRQNKVQRDQKNRAQFTRLDPFITWPEDTRNQWIKTNPGRDLSTIDFGTYLGNIPSDEYRREYLGQFERIVDTIRDWLDETNSNNILGAVRVLGGSGNHRNYVVRQLLSPHRLSPDNHILSDEIFLLQEDIAIKREIFRSLNDLLESYSKLKTEWNEVPYVDIKEQPAPAAPVAIPAASTTGDPVAPPADATPVKKEPEPEVFQRSRFYNYVWPNLLSKQDVEKDAKLASSIIELGLPAIEANKGWRLDLNVLTDPQDEKKLILRSTSSNHSNLFTLPVQPLMIWYSELGTEQEVATPLLLPDAGGVGPSEYWPNGTLKKVGQKKLKDISLPANFGKVTRITRIMPENAIDQQVAFNNDWLVSVQLLRRPNSPTLTLKGEMINRSGRRLPVASFTAGMNVANDARLMNEDFKVPTDAFNAGERRSFTQEIKSAVQPRSINMVKQKLTWRSTPIKRIDRLEIGQAAHIHSDRLKTIPLKPYDFKRKDPLNLNTANTVAAAATPTGDGGSGGPGGMSLGSAGGRAGFGAGGGSGGAAAVSPNHQIPLNRYVQVDNELRRVPVALVMVVDATAITDIIGAMSNSRLRFQVTLAPWTKVPALGKPGGSGASSTGGSGPPAPGGSGGGSSTPPNMSGGGRPGGGMALGSTGGGSGAAAPGGRAGAGGDFVGGGQGGGSTPPTGGAGAGRPTQNMGLEDDSSVVELQIYGLITIYESPDLFKLLEKQATAGAGAPATPK